MSEQEKPSDSAIATIQNRSGPLTTPQRDAVKQRLLEALALTNIISHACDAAGITRATYSAWVREGYLAQEELQDAYERYQDVLRGEITKYGLVGVQVPLVVNGRVVKDAQGMPVYYNKKSERILIELVKRHLPEWREGEKTLIIKSGEDIPDEFRIVFDARELLDDEWVVLENIARAIRERKQNGH